ncbi:hypothetical protein NI17_009990 [Thermobifida halotolerans]|uniref:Uncharacterized protein n=1 Tax=Thermobifida halotolerans TaxID=483545 RepID=A0A399FWY1_9ACTN|nr:hypothetical protein [Thermobifida halotolerans]UOE21408.1 hypothetical protein NI17_009990 [Thermobifida halotolerans]
MNPSRRRLFVLLVWSPALGAALDPVGVLATEDGPAGWRTAVSWVPLDHGAAWPWRQRLAENTPLTAEKVEEWLAQNGTVQLAELDPQPAPSLPHLVEGVLEQILVGLGEV